MVDIHCHILPALDDGAAEEEVSLEMGHMAAADGITQVVATPHSNYQFRFDPEINRAKRDRLQKKLGERPAILLGCDFHISYENLEALRKNPEWFTLNGHQYLLVEFANFNIPPHMDQIFFDIVSHRLIPIITHPERNPILSQKPEQIRKWVEIGCLVQVTAGAFVGRFGKHAERTARLLLRQNLIHFIASDAHNTTSRPLVLSPARQEIAQEMGEEVARALSEDNPRAAVEGRLLPWQPEPQPIPPRKRKWFSLLRG